MKKFIIALIIIAVFVVGFFAGRFDAIHNTELIDYNENEYTIVYNGYAHNYSFGND